MTEYVNVIIDNGKENLLKTGFSGLTATKISYGAVGKGLGVPTSASTGLSSECGSGDGSYARVELTNTMPTVKQVKSEFTLPTTNITNDTTLTEFGLVDDAIAGDSVFFCICQIPPTTKNDDISLKFTVITTFE
jgi:hypothetical protein